MRRRQLYSHQSNNHFFILTNFKAQQQDFFWLRIARFSWEGIQMLSSSPGQETYFLANRMDHFNVCPLIVQLVFISLTLCPTNCRIPTHALIKFFIREGRLLACFSTMEYVVCSTYCNCMAYTARIFLCKDFPVAGFSCIATLMYILYWWNH